VNIMAIDTSHREGSVAVRLGQAEPVHCRFGTARSHLAEIGEAVALLLREVGVPLGDVDRVALVIGPGSFTGLRIGLAYVKGLYAALAMDVVTTSSLELLAMSSLVEHDTVCAMIDARKSEVYAAVYQRKVGPTRLGYGEPRLVGDRPRAVAPDQFLASLEVRPMVFVGSGAARFRASIKRVFGDDASFESEAFNQPSAAVLCRAGRVLAPLGRDEILRLEPFYIRPSDAKLSSLGHIRTHD
jgi:tRNA threonylcarbamoyladenosine biosynthesis protein TsaB